MPAVAGSPGSSPRGYCAYELDANRNGVAELPAGQRLSSPCRPTSQARTASPCTVGGRCYCPTLTALSSTMPTTSMRLGTGLRIRSWRRCTCGSLPARETPAPSPSEAAQTSYVAVVGAEDAAWAGEEPRKVDKFQAGLSQTIMLVEVANSGILLGGTEETLSLDALEEGDPTGSLLRWTCRAGISMVQISSTLTTTAPGSTVLAMADGSIQYVPSGMLSARKSTEGTNPRRSQAGGI